MRLRARIDANQTEIVTQLRQIPGVTVQPLHTVGSGCPDLLVGFRGRNFLFEIKDGSKPPSARQLTEDEQDWHRQWAGQVSTIITFDEALIVLGLPTPRVKMEPGVKYRPHAA